MLRPLLIFTLVVALGWNFREFWISPPESFFKPTATSADVPKASTYMLNTDTRQFDEQGQLSYRLTSDRSEHFTATQHFILEKPRITSFQGDARPWTLESDSGVVEKKQGSTLLTGNVVGHHFRNDGATITLETPSLLFYPEKQYAESDKTVTISIPGANTSGVGLKADLKSGQYELLSKVKGTLDAKPK